MTVHYRDNFDDRTGSSLCQKKIPGLRAFSVCQDSHYSESRSLLDLVQVNK